MSLLLIVLLILLLAGGGLGYHTWGAMGGGISVGTVLVIILVYTYLVHSNHGSRREANQ